MSEDKINESEDIEEINRKQEAFIKIFEKKLCNIKSTCLAVGICRQTYYNWMDKVDTFKKRVTDIEESLYDDLESKMYKKAIVDEDNVMLIFIAKTKMKHRGYTERTEIDNLLPKEPVEVRIIRSQLDER